MQDLQVKAVSVAFVDPALAITNHAVTRYVQRILHTKLDGPFECARDEARAHCRAVGLTIRKVRQIIWTPGLALAVRMGLPSVDNGHFLALIETASGAVVTIFPPRPKEYGRLKLLSEREFARKAQRVRRKEKRRPTVAGLKAHLDEEGVENA
jgi:hypothetical protein